MLILTLFCRNLKSFVVRYVEVINNIMLYNKGSLFFKKMAVYQHKTYVDLK